MSTYILKYTSVAQVDRRKYVAIDNRSGGYPYAVEWHMADIFTDLEQAKSYAKMFGFLVCQIKPEINGVVQE